MDIIKTLLANRGIKTAEEIKEFLNPPLPEFKLNSKKAISRIKLAIKNKEAIIVYGDYDADGICATAIMWETLNSLGGQVLPFIPAREDEGYGLSIEGIKKIEANLIIVVDSGIVANEAVDYANSKKIDVIILDHHEKPKKLPKAFAIVHIEKLCASGIVYFISKELLVSSIQKPETSLELAAIATVTDLMPLIGINRSIVKYGLEALNKTSRPGLKALFETAGITNVGTYEIGYLIGPRLNAAGRIDSALTALRLLCTKDREKAHELASQLNKTNQERQSMVIDQTIHAIKQVTTTEKIIVIEDESYHQGIIGLIAGKLVEKHYLPTVVISKGEKISKASARSIAGFNIIEAIRSCEEILINAGGHPMAAGFTIETSQIENFKLQISNFARKAISEDMLKRKQRVDMEIPIDFMNLELYKLLSQLAPFGIGNPEPVFSSTVTLDSFRSVGAEGKHLKLVVNNFDAIAFNQGPLASKLKVGDSIKIAYSLDLNTFNGKQNLQLKVKDINFAP